MKVVDVLKLLYENKISLKEAQNVIDGIVEQYHQGSHSLDWRLAAGFSNFEATAYAQGAFLNDIAKFRYEGWPNSCWVCNLPLDFTQYGWLVVYDEHRHPCLKHVVCPVTSQ